MERLKVHMDKNSKKYYDKIKKETRDILAKKK